MVYTEGSRRYNGGMERKFEFEVGEFYHIYSRGVEKRLIFTTEADHVRFRDLLFISNSTKPFNYREVAVKSWDKIDRAQTLVDIGAYCLMPNHFHLLVKEKVEGGISRFMSKLLTAYSKYFNIKYERKGRLFESTFKAQHADDDVYLRHLFAYIHLNPVKIKEPDWEKSGLTNIERAKKYLKNYSYSSYLDYAGVPRGLSKILNRSEFPDYFPSTEDFSRFLEDCLTLPSPKLEIPDDYRNPRRLPSG